ncbi:hypothetical protein NPIL_520401 [Nephila pilipes]|uniref:Uncharacterized protein n=1 Tax=Nephila pilipes TaxID=299642 RepID=A0A8X6NCC9_NEPPI|nr:hypothetical protein NPIL_520401 [Nephila pilipes]
MAEDKIKLVKWKRATAETKFCKHIENELIKEDINDLQELLEHLTTDYKELKASDKEFETIVDLKDLAKELEGVEEYTEKEKECIYRSRSSCPHSARCCCFSDSTKDSEHRQRIPYVQLTNALQDPGKRFSVDPSSVDGRVLKTKYGRIVKRFQTKNLKK